jgi:hypothetical protein
VSFKRSNNSIHINQAIAVVTQNFLNYSILDGLKLFGVLWNPEASKCIEIELTHNHTPNDLGCQHMEWLATF